MWKRLRVFIAELQKAELEIRKKWMWISGVAAAFVVLLLGLFTFQGIIPSIDSVEREVAQSQNPAATPPGVAQVVSTGIWEGVKQVWKTGKSIFDFLGGQIGTTHKVDIIIDNKAKQN